MDGLTLIRTADGLALDVGDGHPVRIDLAKLDTTSGPGRRLTAPLLRAVGIRKGQPHRPRIVDATAGYGEDAWLLASAGCEVTAVERLAVMVELLRDAIDRAGRVQPDTAARIEVVEADSRTFLAALAEQADAADRPDVVYLDPMFPRSRRHRSAAERKPMRVLRTVAGDDADADELLAPALAAARRRVVIKRPSHAPPLGNVRPVATHRGKAIRYDVHPAA